MGRKRGEGSILIFFLIVKEKLGKVQEHRGETEESLSMRERKFLTYNTQLSGTGHGSTESMRKYDGNCLES